MALSPKQRKQALEKGLSVNLSGDEEKYLSPNPKAAVQLFTRPLSESESSPELPADGLPERQTVDRKGRRQTVSHHYRQTPPLLEPHEAALLPADGRPVVPVVEEMQPAQEIPLAPVQWAIWEALREAEAAGRVVSYRRLAHRANATIRGVRDALAVIEKEGGIRSKVTVRTPDEQGMRIALNPRKRFKPASLKETKGLLKRGSDYRQTVDRKSVDLPADGLRLSVCITDNIKQTDIADLLHVTPLPWKIRERTLVEIARTFPGMTALEFRRSLMHLVEQTAKSHQPIRNHNAWLKAAFAKNEGPLITERMIEAQLDQTSPVPKAGQGRTLPLGENDTVQADFEALRRYLTAGPEERTLIEQMAHAGATPALRMLPSEKHKEIQEHALIEAAREFFARKTQDA
ncbi:MAG TPA: hypothetical protein VGX03_35010 [Candidatus Binatia bacterium]|jgi:hypothetical protein|nr:hypothetical protein [Candidatus Binatia bacterium]